ncbi:hypothetical protein AB8O38_11285 [Saccharomonospora xinjiangensis]|uniref:hypothetical protein n=1 Tax=Saccharomonospora xinjiangensis TaxID=75294 RepID=UPI00350F92C5
MVAVVVQADAELGDLEQPAEQRLGCVGEVERQVRQRVQQGHVRRAGAAGLGLVGGVELGDGGQGGGLLRFQVVVGAPQGLGERVVRVAVLGLPQDRVLPPRHVRDDPLEPFPLGLPLAGGPVVESDEVGGQDLTPLGAEHAVGEEP